MLHHVLVLVQLHQLRALDSQVRGLDKHHGIGTVHHRHLRRTVTRYVEDLFFLSRGEQLTRPGTGRILKIHVDAGTGAGNPLDHLVPVNHSVPVLHPHMLLDDLVRIGVENPHHRHGLHRRNQALVDGKGTYGGGNIAAVGASVHSRNHDVHLAEGVVHVHALPVRRRDHRDLAGGGNSSAHTVDLLYVRRAHHLQENLLPLPLVLRQVLLVEKYGLAGAAAHIHTGIFLHIHCKIPPFLFDNPSIRLDFHSVKLYNFIIFHSK